MDETARPRTHVGVKTLPSGYYTDPTWHDRELERIHYDMWLYAGRADRIASAGDYFLCEVGRASIIVLRDDGGRIRAFHNVCRHRGTRLCKEAEGRLPLRIRCHYHAWTYRLDGSLAHAPHMDGVDGFCEADYPLNAVHVATWEGHIFVSMAERPIPLDQHLTGLDVRFRNWQMGDLRVGARRSYAVNANWKLIVQNYHECLHCPVAHPQLNRQSHYLSGVNHPTTPTYLGSRMDLRDGFRTLSKRDDPPRSPLPALTEDERRGVYYYAILPNLLLNLHPDYVLTFRFNPRAVDRTEILCEWLFHPGEIAKPDFDPSDAVDFWDQTNRQDWELSDLAQAGISSLGYLPGPYGHREDFLMEVDRWLFERVGATITGAGPAT